MATILDHFKCPVCLEIPECKVFQCINGHTFCSQCSVRLKLCPQCRTQLPLAPHRIRNRTLEQLLDLMEFSCPNKTEGCGKLLKRHEILGHLKFCKFEPFYFCKLIGFLECPYNASNSTSLVAHLHEAHPEIRSQAPFPAQVDRTPADAGSRNENEYECDNDHPTLLIYQNLLGRANNTLDKGSVSIWTPHLVHFTDHDSDQKHYFLVLCQISDVTRHVAWVCLRIAEETSNTNNKCDAIQFKISAHQEDEQIPKMTWTAPILNFQDIDKDLENYALRIPFCALNLLLTTTNTRLKENNGNVQVSLLIFCGGKKKLKDNGRVVVQNVVQIKELTSFITKTPWKGRPKCCGCCYSRSPDDNGQLNENDEGDEAEDRGPVFHDVYCNGCGQRPLIDIRYKCLQCIDYDLCKRCMAKRDTHSHHVFARIQDERQNELLNLKHRVR